MASSLPHFLNFIADSGFAREISCAITLPYSLKCNIKQYKESSTTYACYASLLKDTIPIIIIITIIIIIFMFARKKSSWYYYGDVQTCTTKFLQRLKNCAYHPETQQTLNHNVMIIILFRGVNVYMVFHRPYSVSPSADKMIVLYRNNVSFSL